MPASSWALGDGGPHLLRSERPTTTMRRMPWMSRQTASAIVFMALACPLWGCAYFFDADATTREFRRALRLQRRGHDEAALVAYGALAPRARRLEGALNNMALIFARRGDVARAEQLLRLGTRVGANNCTVWLNLGLVLATRGQVREARWAWQQVRAARDRLLDSAPASRHQIYTSSIMRRSHAAIARAERYLRGTRASTRPRRESYALVLLTAQTSTSQ
ncbi:MAG: hypothetical protein KC503_25165 [Myxococcales bacterium]|nr:hypothetical protein [Myxococcales bacterium]